MKHCKFEDLSGRRFGYLTVISYAGHKNNRIYFNCKCDNKTTNHYITYNGETKTISQWSSITGISPSVMFNRLVRHKWSVERALTEPLNIEYVHNKKRGSR